MDKQSQRLKNLVLFKVHATDEELEQSAVIVVPLLVVGLIVFGIYCLLRGH